MATGGVNLSKEFFELLKAIGESKSKQEEDRIISKEVQCLKQKLEPPPPGSNPPLQSKKRAKEFLVRYVRGSSVNVTRRMVKSCRGARKLV